MVPLALFEYRHGDLSLRGRIARPAGAGPGPFPAILVMRGAGGLRGTVERRARDLAELGYVALATDMYGVGPDEPAPDEVGGLLAELLNDPVALRGRVIAAFDALRSLPEVDASRIVAIGYCFGGRCVIELARSGADVKAVVSLHGQLDTSMPAGPGAIRARILVATGAQDPHCPLPEIPRFAAEMEQAGAQWHLTLYSNAAHSFADPEAPSRFADPGLRYDPMLDRLSWAQAMEFLAAFV